MKRSIRMLFAAVLAVALLAGALGAIPALAASKAVKTTKIKLKPSKTINLAVGETRTIEATLKPKNSTQKVKWSSSNKKVATVSGKGVVKAKGRGTATITAKSGSVKAEVKVNVTVVKTTKVVLSRTSAFRLKVGGEKALKATLKPKNSTQKVKWSSSDKTVATVSNKGVVKAVGEGTAIITAKSGAAKASVKVTVTANSAPEPEHTATPEPDPTAVPEPEHTATPEPDLTAVPEPEQEKALVAYFSCTGTTEAVAKRLARAVGADLYRIVPAVAYTDEDLDYGDRSNRATWEQDHPETRPKLGGESVDLKDYATVYLGYPIWWGMEPRIMCSFVEAHDFTGITVIPFCTSGSSGIGSSGSDLKKLAGSGSWLSGARHSASISEDELRAWAEGLR